MSALGSHCRQAATRAVRAAIATDPQHGAVVPPLHLSSTFAFEGFDRKRAYDYTRSGNPTRSQLADALAELEGGAAAVVTSTGMSAVALVLHLLNPGDLVLAAHDCYGGTHRLLKALSADLHRVDPAAIRVPSVFVAAEGDTLVPESQIAELATRAGGPRRFVRLATRYGHDAFLTEPTQVGRILAAALRGHIATELPA